jgi:hypothetical protein
MGMNKLSESGKIEDVDGERRVILPVYVSYPNTNPEARQRGQIMTEQIRQMLKGNLDGSLEETMKSLRGRL